ncbi:MAG: hypothetical protein IK088_09885 [Lachnospiraceae bacterium]|nr:hypothetical protein [Lachnospiraceae bacterium]
MEEAGMNQLLKYEKRQVAIGWIRLAVTVLLFVVAVTVAVLFLHEVKKIDATMKTMGEIADEMQKTLGELDIAEVNRTVTALRGASETLSKIDSEQLNDLIGSLKNTADTLSKVDADHLNSLIVSLEKATEGLNSIIGVFQRLFGRN